MLHYFVTCVKRQHVAESLAKGLQGFLSRRLAAHRDLPSCSRLAAAVVPSTGMASGKGIAWGRGIDRLQPLHKFLGGHGGAATGALPHEKVGKKVGEWCVSGGIVAAAMGQPCGRMPSRKPRASIWMPARGWTAWARPWAEGTSDTEPAETRPDLAYRRALTAALARLPLAPRGRPACGAYSGCSSDVSSASALA
ncbi:hypothetical protein M2375_001813 [Comamonas sp. BIGb0152]|nr:hypothetical protein [Comamonas sp. BIGb0152]